MYRRPITFMDYDGNQVTENFEFNLSKVEGYRLLGYENRRLAAKDFNDDKKDAGEIGSGHTMTAFYEIIPAGTGEMGAGTDPLKYQKSETAKSGELMTVKMRYKKPDGKWSWLGLGGYGTGDHQLSGAQARQKAAELREDAAKGGNPLATKRAQRLLRLKPPTTPSNTWLGSGTPPSAIIGRMELLPEPSAR